MDLNDASALLERREAIENIRGHSSGVLAEAQVRELSKSLTKLRLKDENAVDDEFLRHVRSLIGALLMTLLSNRTSLGHGAATCDALCGLLELCEASASSPTRALAFDCSMWTKAFETYLNRSENNKSKPMRHLLLTLVKIVSKYPNESGRIYLIKYAVSSAIHTIDGDVESSSSIKAAVQALELFLSKHIINAPQLVCMLNEKRESGHLDMTVEYLRPDSLSSTLEIDWVKSTEDFMSSILQWVQYADIVPAAGRLSSSFFLSLQKHAVQHKLEIYNDQAMPLWLPSIKKALNEESEALEGLEKHILPGLLRLSSADTQAFLKTLPLKDLQEGIVGIHTVGDIQLCLLTAKIVVEVRASHGSHLPKTTNLNVQDLQNLGLKLLVHASPEIRISALDLAIYSRSSTEPLPREVLDALRQTLPHFHAEVNAKARNGFLNQMKKLCTRLQSSVSSLKKIGRNFRQVQNGRKNSSHQMPIQPINKDTDSDASLMGQQISFLNWYADFLTRELRPTSSYQRHITALKILSFQLLPDLDTGAVRLPAKSASDSDTEPSQMSIFTAQLLRCVLDLMLDPFDDVRHAATTIAELFPPVLLFTLAMDNTESITSTEHKKDDEAALAFDSRGLVNTLYRAEAIMRATGRADHADGVGRLYSLLYGTCQNNAKPYTWYHSRESILVHILQRLEHDIRLARNDMRTAVAKYPLHGYLIALRYIVRRPDFYDSLTHDFDTLPGNWMQLNQRLIRNCENVWEAVREVLCIDSPEGHSSEDDEIHGLEIGTKDTLSFSWRGLKESSSLIHGMVANPGYGPPNPEVGLRRGELEKMGTLAFTQLAELRHRGAFSTVSQTFAACCILCAQRKTSSIPRLRWKWYENALASIQQNASKLTRRSAGIPSMITGILASFPDGDFLIGLMLDLQAIADESVESTSANKELRLPQVHALNCLRDIFTDTRLGPGTELYVADTLDISASCIESNIWEIRNCGLMLFKALIRRLNGGSDTSSTKASSSHRRFSKLVYEKYSNLPDLLVKMLRQVDGKAMYSDRSEISASMQAQRVFPALEIIEVSGLPTQREPEIKKLMWHHMESSAWPIREKAAKALGLVLRDTDRHADIETLLHPDWQSQNALHGRLLYLRHILSRNKPRLPDRSPNDVETLLPLFIGSFEIIVVSNKCPFTVAAYLNVVADVLEVLLGTNSKFSQPFALKCREFLSKRWPLELKLGDLKESFQGRSSSLFTLALERCLGLINEAGCSAAQVALVSTAFTMEKVPIEKNDAISSEIMFNAVLPDKSLCRSPQNCDEALRLDGNLVAQQYVTKPIDSSTQIKLSAWVCALRLAGDDRSELSTRMAAVASMKDFMTVMQVHKSISKTAPELLDVYLTLYNALIDDDEDVRDQASAVTSSLLSASSSAGDPKEVTSLSLSPLAASPRLLQFLVQEYNASVHLWSDAVRRLTGASSSPIILRTRDAPALQLRPVQVLLQEALPTDNTLFVEEKQNLFIDEVKEAEMWASALADLHPQPEAISNPTLETWAVEGISALSKIVKNEFDGPFGWTSKPEVFMIGMRVTLAAKSILHGHKVNNSSFGEKRCRDALITLLDIGKKQLVHDLWLQGIDDALGLDQ